MGAREKGPKRFRQGAGRVYSCVARFSFVRRSLQKQDVVILLKNSTPKNSAVFLIGYNDEPDGGRHAEVSHNLALHKRLLTPLVFTETAAQRKRGEEQKRVLRSQFDDDPEPRKHKRSSSSGECLDPGLAASIEWASSVMCSSTETPRVS